MVDEAGEMRFTVWTVTYCTIIQNKHNIIYYKHTYIHITFSSIQIPNVGCHLHQHKYGSKIRSTGMTSHYYLKIHIL